MAMGNTTKTPVVTGAKADAAAVAAAKPMLSGDSSTSSPYYTPSSYNVYQLTQTSPQDITAYVNAAMQQLVGRNATPEEIQMYGRELLAAQKANQGLSSQTTSYQQSGASTGKRGATVGTNLSTGVDPSAFLQTLISGTAEAGSYKAATKYMDAMLSANNQFRGA
jgi:hypothetical protein